MSTSVSPTGSYMPTGVTTLTTRPSGTPTITDVSSPSPSNSMLPSESPVVSASVSPTGSYMPTGVPTLTARPSGTPTITGAPTPASSESPTHFPSSGPTVTSAPTFLLSKTPSTVPSQVPTITPEPTALPSISPEPSSEPSSSTQAPSNEPSLAPTEACAVSDRETALLVTLESVFDTSLVQDPVTPQSAAFDWLVSTDVGTDPCDRLQVIQRYALAVFYESTDGTNWAVDDGWLSMSPVCDWFEVECLEDNSTIFQITLFDNNLSGTLPQELAALTTLRDFDVFFNSLVGTVPDYFSFWPDLILFDVENNTLTGEPLVYLDGSQDMNTDTGTLLPNLRFFRLSHNEFEGSLDPSVARQLSNVQQLWIAGNKFTGQIPSEIEIFAELGTSSDQPQSTGSTYVLV